MAENRQTIIIEDRRRLSVNGVNNVESFDENRIQLSGVLGGLDINGEQLKINGLDLDKGQVSISGLITSLAYGLSEEQRSMRHKSKNALARLLK